MLSVEQYLAKVLELFDGVSMGVEATGLADACGRVLARDVMARVAVPPFDNSAMDGYAVRAADLGETPVTLVVLGESAAAPGPIPDVRAGGAVRVMTGARMPPGSDAVVPVELTDQPIGAVPLPRHVRLDHRASIGDHVRRMADDVAMGTRVLSAGELLTPAAVAGAASVGHDALYVARRPRVAVLATGAELADPGSQLAVGQIPDSNAVMLAGLAEASGAEVVAMSRSGDDPRELADLLRALPATDLILTTGGVSAGVHEPLRQVRADLDFQSVAMQPGKPQGCGLVGGIPLLAFPGNPVSAFVSFLVFGRPAIDALTGLRRRTFVRWARAAQGWTSTHGRRQYIPARLQETPEGAVVMPSHRRGSGSHLIASLHAADVLAVVAADCDAVATGDPVQVVDL